MENSNSPEKYGKDAAWASIKTPLTADDLFAFCLDVERLFRINPYLEFQQWQVLDDGRILFSGRNSSQKMPFEFHYEITVNHDEGRQIRLSYGEGSLKASTTIGVEPLDRGSQLTITDDYGQLSEMERKRRLDEVDQSLTQWLQDIQSYLVLWQRWSKVGLWRWYMRRIWQPLKPNGRRIVYMLLWITVVEIALILLGVGIYFAEYA